LQPLLHIKKKKWNEIKNIPALKDVSVATLFIGVLYFSLFFLGLKFTTPGNASIIALLEVFFSFLFFNIFKKEPYTIKQVIGGLSMFLGAVIIFLPGVLENLSLNKGDLFILLAVIFPPFGNFYTRRAREKISSEMILFFRTLLSLPIILIFALLVGESINFSSVREPLLYIILSGILSFGLAKIFWVEGIRYIAVAKANALNSVIPLFTMFYAFILLNQKPTLIQILSFIPIFLGILLITHQKNELSR
jgi:drug/metabolite transporter (DMT)-like permease